MLYHRNPQGWAWVAGRVTFFLVMAATVANCGDVNDAKDALRGLTYGVGVLGLLTIVHAVGFVDLQFAWPARWAGRTFGPVQIPFPRTLGIRMTYNKFGVLAAAALATVLAPSAGDEPFIRPSWFRVALFCTIMAAVLLSQTRGVYLTILWTLGLSAAFALRKHRRFQWLSSTSGAWWAAGSYALLLVLGNVLFLAVAPAWLVNVGYAQSVRNVLLRLDLNARGWLVFQRAPLLGIGHGTFPNLQPGGMNIHNHFWEQFVSTGIVGGIPYLLFHLLILVGALRLLGSSRPSLRAVALVLVVSVSATYLAYQFSLAFFTSVFAVICGLVLSVKREDRRRSRARNEQTT
jgi:O-antigen ligase